MQFELHIQCTKDLNKLNIEFTDGTTVVQEVKTSKNPVIPDSGTWNAPAQSENANHKPEDLIDLDVDYDHVSQEVIVIFNIPTGMPLVSELDDELNLEKR